MASRAPAPPAELAGRLAAFAGKRRFASTTEMIDALLDGAEKILAGDLKNRSAANDLLLADALITYAMEAAADDEATLERTATAALHRFASSAANHGES